MQARQTPTRSIEAGKINNEEETKKTGIAS